MKRYCYFLTVLLLCSCTSKQSNVLDEIDFGNISNEVAHELTASSSNDYTNEEGLTARRFLQERQIKWKAGECTFTMKVDSAKQNYFTALFNGKEICNNYMMLFINGKQIGYRMGGDIEPLYRGNNVVTDKYYYSTLPLPIDETLGKTEVKLGIRCYGPLNEAGTTFDDFQLDVEKSSVGVYKGYTHVEPQCVTADDFSVKKGSGAVSISKELGAWVDSLPENSANEWIYSDEQHGNVVVKDDDVMLYASLYWQSPYAVNKLAKVCLATPECDYVSIVYEEAKVNFCGLSYRRPGFVGSNDGSKEWYRGVRLANAGEKMLISKVPRSMQYRPGMANEYAGKAKYYKLVYGDYLIAMNTTQKETFTLELPADFINSKNLSDKGNTFSAKEIVIAPKTTLVLKKE